MQIRLARPSDGPQLARIYEPAFADPPLSFELTPPDGGEMSRRVVETVARLPWLVAETESVLGYAYAAPHRSRPAYGWSTEVSIYLSPEAHRRGIGRLLYSTLFSVLGLQGYQNAYAIITLPNEPSCRFHEVMGFERIAIFPRSGYKLGRWLDTGWYGRSLGDHPPNPPLPRPLAELVGSADFSRILSQTATGG